MTTKGKIEELEVGDAETTIVFRVGYLVPRHQAMPS
jgi:hypothetical protein